MLSFWNENENHIDKEAIVHTTGVFMSKLDKVRLQDSSFEYYGLELFLRL